MADKIQLNGLIDRWIIDYRCRELFNTFEKNGFVSSDSCNLAYFTLNLPKIQPYSSPGGDTYPRSVLLIDLMCKLSNGRTIPKQSTRKNKTSAAHDITTLEEAIEALNRLIKETDLNKFVSDADVARFKLALKRQAVYVCCRLGNFKLASAVFDRQFAQWKMGDVKAKNEVAGVLSANTTDHPKLTTESYDALINEGRAFLHKIICQLPIPFLTSVAQNVSGNLQNQETINKSVINNNFTEILRGTSVLPKSSTALQLQKSETLTVQGSHIKPVMVFTKSDSVGTAPPLSLLTKTDQNVPSVLATKGKRKQDTGTCKYIVQGRNIVDSLSASSLANESVGFNNTKLSEPSEGSVKSDVRPLMLFSRADLTTNKAVALGGNALLKATISINPTISINRLELSKLKSGESKVTGIPKIASKRRAKSSVLLSSSVNSMNTSSQNLKKRKIKDSVDVSKRPRKVAVARSYEAAPKTTDFQAVQSPESSKRLKKLPKRFEDDYVIE